jgi:hypothetical protein
MSHDDGLIKARNAVELYPQVAMFHVLLSNFYLAKGQDDLSGQAILAAEENSGGAPERLTALKAAYGAKGTTGLRQKRIESNKKTTSRCAVNAYDIAVDCAAVNDREQALAWLAKAFHARDSKMPLIGVEPIFDDLRPDPRFQTILRQMGLGAARS